MQSISIDQKSIMKASAGQLDMDSFFETLELPKSNTVTKCVQIEDNGYILSREFQPKDAILTISLQQDGPLTGLSASARRDAFGRLIRCTTLIVDGRSQSIPTSWRPYHFNNRLAFQADRILRRSGGGRTDAGRIVIEISQDKGYRIFAFYLDVEGGSDLSVFQSNGDLHLKALSGIRNALALKEESAALETIGNDVALDKTLPDKMKTQVSLDDWYAARLTGAQRKFVNHPLFGSVRLVGPAGSGKTVALVVKCLRELHQHNNDQPHKRFLFLTHASVTAAGIENIILSMDPEGGLSFISAESPSLIITTLYSLANGQMRYDLDSLTPVSLDGYEGRSYQADILNAVIEDYKNGDWIAFKSACSGPFIDYMEAEKDSTERRFFLWELLNEFACVLDAEGIRSGTVRREQYLSEKRKNWMMVLQSREERDVVLQLYDRFRSWLRSAKAIGCDQMITDYLNYLDSFRWEAIREQEGFDVIFVDELHLFNRQERMVFRHLLRHPDNAPTVFMAYDAKQSPRDTFLGLPANDTDKYDHWKDARLGKVEKIELVDVFRYTPQIAHALFCIDQSFPGQDLDDDWPAFSGIARTQDGPIPIVCTLKSTVATYTKVFRRASEFQRKLSRGNHVAVLCASNELFKRYLDWTDLRDLFYAITSRDDLSEMPNSSRKFVFSMPEFVAGLQFDTVLLIDVNRAEIPEGPYSAAAQRKFASNIYLGASRAERQLEIYASQEQGGISPIISRAVLDNAIKLVEERDHFYT